MKFWQRQLLLIPALVCGCILLLLHSRTPDNLKADLSLARSGAGAALVQNPAFFTHGGGDDARLALRTRNESGEGEGRLVEAAHLPFALRVDGNQSGAGRLRTHGQREPPRTAEGRGGDRRLDGTPAPVFSYYAQRESDGECPEVLRPAKMTENQTFQPVDSQRGLFVFSAFLDAGEKQVRVVGLNSLKQRSAFCLLWYSDGGRELRVMSASISPLPESHSRRYSAAYIQCPLPDERQPYAVSLTTTDCRRRQKDAAHNDANDAPALQPSNVLPVQREGQLRRNFTVCVTALNYRYSRAYELVEMLELNRVLGAERFTFYVNSVGDNVAQVLRWYQRQGLVELVPWDLPVNVDHWPPNRAKPPEVHYFAQLASHNDCLNRNRGSSRYLVYQDLDEFIIPKKRRTWMEMLEDLKSSQHSALLFRCIFFRKDWPRNQEDFPGRDVADKFRSVVLSTDKREPSPFPPSQRAKYIVDPTKVHTVGIHNIWRHRGPEQILRVAEKDGLLHHYRDWENPGDKSRAVRDTDMYRYREELLARLAERWAQLPSVPLDIPLSSYGQV